MSELSSKQKDVVNEIIKMLKPKPAMNVLEFAEEYGVLSPENSAVTGSFKAFPYQKDMLVDMSDDSIELIVFMKSTRTGWTRILTYAMAYNIAIDPCPQIIFHPNDKKAGEFSKKEMKPLLRDMKVVGEKIIKSREDNTLNFKAYPGGFIESRGGQTPNNFASATVKKLFFDEFDRLPKDVGNEGSPYELGVKRTESYWNGSVFLGSTPTIKDHSMVEDMFNATDMRYRYLPCPSCNHYQILDFKNIVWDKEYREGVETHLTHTAKLRCTNCETLIDHGEKRNMDVKGRWRQTQKFYCCDEWQDPKLNDNWFRNPDDKYDKRNGEALCVHCDLTAEYNRNGRKKRGYHIWAAYSFQPNTTWIKIAETFVDAIGNVEKMKSFKNTWLGETFEEKSVKLESNELMDKAEDYQNVPDDAKIVLMTVDTQDTWLEWVITSWSMGETSHNIKTGKIMGDPINQYVWDELLAIKRQALKTESGRDVKVYKGFIDMAGHRTDEVKKFIRKHGDEFVMLRGDPREPKDVDARPTSFIKKMEKEDYVIMWVATTKVKDIIFQRLTLQPHEHGFIHHNRSFGVEWFKGLASEKKVFKKSAKGKLEQTYINVAEDRRNEPLDITVYQLAAIRLIQAQIPSFDLSIKTEEN